MTATATPRKTSTTCLEYAIQGNYGQGWEDVSTYSAPDYENPRKSALADLREYNLSGTGAHRLITRRALREDYTLAELENLPTISQGQMDDLKIQTKYIRVWLSRMTKDDGMPYDNQVTIERLNSSYNWVTISQFQAKTA
jgi:hypothetical protein